jgi:hypothetical protein
MRDRSSALVGVAPVMFVWRLVVATMIVAGESYWELFGATNLTEGYSLGGSGPKYVVFGLGNDWTAAEVNDVSFLFLSEQMSDAE